MAGSGLFSQPLCLKQYLFINLIALGCSFICRIVKNLREVELKGWCWKQTKKKAPTVDKLAGYVTQATHGAPALHQQEYFEMFFL